MTFSWKITRPARTQQYGSTEMMYPGVDLNFETGSIKEAHGIFGDESSSLTEIFGSSVLGLADLATAVAVENEVAAEQGATAAEPKKERKPRKGADPATASAPPPLAVPSAAPPAPVAPPNLQEGSNGIPAFLDRTAAPPPPPLLPSAPPVVPAAPPPVAGPLGLKVIAEVQRRSVDDAAKATMVAWLSSPAAGLAVPGATFDEAIACLHMVTDDKMGGVAAALQIAA